MFLKYLLILFVFVSNISNAVNVSTIADGDWDDPAIWSGHAVPTNPDSIIIYHYVTISRDITINSPTVLCIKSIGTLCGEHLLKTLCGAIFVNYGHMYLRDIETKYGINYNKIESKNYINISGCSPSTPGFSNISPNGTVKVWPPVFCKTVDTNWESGHPVGLTEIENDNLKIYPNPITNEDLIIIASSHTKMKLMDVVGKEIENRSFENRIEIPFNSLPNGIYFLELTIDGKKSVRKILKSN